MANLPHLDRPVSRVTEKLPLWIVDFCPPPRTRLPREKFLEGVLDGSRVSSLKRSISLLAGHEQMSRVLDVDVANGTAHIQAGVVGRKMAEELAERGVTMGHEPDSLEFSTLGGWVATRASGMKRGR